VLVRNSGLKPNIFHLLFIGILFLIFYSVNASAQEHKKGETIFGLEAKAIIPTSILNAGTIKLSDDSITIKINPESGYSIGMLIRHNFTKMFTLETGIHLTKRLFPIDFDHSLNGISEQSKIEMISYSIPIQWLLYIQLGKQTYMNTILGVSMDFYPSSIKKESEKYAYIITPNSWIEASLLASVGFEYRSKKSGYFYIGSSLHSPFGDMGSFKLTYYHDSSLTEHITFNSNISGTYLSIDFRYFFNKKEKKKKIDVH
jgi:hypothetical protein